MYKQKVNGLVLIYIYKLGPWIIDKLNLNNKWTHRMHYLYIYNMAYTLSNPNNYRNF